MRAGPLSDAKVIALLNRAFVCVYTVNEDYVGKKATAPPEERKELQRIHQEGHKKKLSVGTVHAYVLTPDGHTHDSLHVASAARTERVLAYFYPQTENNHATTDRIEKQSLMTKVLSVEGGKVTARIDGILRMQHVFYPGRNNPDSVQATVVGVLTFPVGKPGVPSLQLVTAKAAHGKRTFAVAVRSLQ